MMHVINLKERTKGGVQEHVRILDVLNAGLQEFGQMAVPNACHLQYEQKRMSKDIQEGTFGQPAM